MKNNEILETVQLNKKDKDTRIVLIFIASLLAFVATIYGAFRVGKKKGAHQASESDANAKKQSGKIHARSASNRRVIAKRRKIASVTQDTSATSANEPAVSGPVYVVRPIHEKKRESRGQRFKRHMCAAASVILMVSLVGSSAMQYVEPSTALAKESFTGIGRIVSEHEDDDEPYRILDIVPADAVYNGYTFDISTMGYLVDGEAPIIANLQKIFTENKESFYSYEARKGLIDAVTLSGSDFGVTYTEGYLGVDFQSAPAGWTRIFDKTNAPETDDLESEDQSGSSGEDDEDESEDDESDDLTYATGQPFRGNVTAWVVGVDKTGYDYKPVTALSSLNDFDNMIGTPDGTFMRGKSGNDFRLRFKPAGVSDGQTGGYVAVDFEEIDNANFTSWVYILVDGVYVPVYATVGDLVGVPYDISGNSSDNKTEEKPKEEKPKQEETSAPGVTNPGTGTETPGIDNPNNPGTGAETPEEGDPNNPGTGTETPEEGDPNNPGMGTETPEEGDPNNPGTGTETPGEVDPNNPGTETETPGVDNPNNPGTGTETQGSDDSDISPLSLPLTEPILFSGSLTLSGGWRLLAEGDEPDSEGDGEYHASEGGGEYYASEHESTEDADDIDWDAVNQKLAELKEQGYVVAFFQYVPSAEPGVMLYEIDKKEPIGIGEGDGIPYPDDSYYLDGSSDSGYLDPDYLYSTLEASPDASVQIPVPFDSMLNTSGDAIKYVYIGPGEGTHKLERNSNGNYMIQVQGAPIYFKCSAGKDWLKKYVFSTLDGGDNESSKFEIDVITKLANEVSREEVQDADLIFLESENGNTVLNMNAMSLRYIGEYYADMDERALTEILRSAAEDLKPVIVDYDIVKSEEHYKDSNYQYLAKALRKQDLAEFFKKMNKDGKLLENLRTGKNVENSDDSPLKKDNDYDYVNRNVYMMNSSTPLVSGDFHDEFDSDRGFKDVTEAIDAENILLSEDNKISRSVSKAKAIQYIINFSVGIIGDFYDLSILEIQPSSNRDSDLYLEDGKIIKWKTESTLVPKQILANKETFELTKEVKSVAEFNGEWEDINSTYDIIFIGLDGQRLNWDEDEEKTVYNNSNLNGKVYHKGDDSGVDGRKYDANDLTAQKMDALLEYLEAGYPVLVEDGCFINGTARDVGADDVSDEYIQEGTIMNLFLKAAVTDERYKDSIFTVSDAMFGAKFITRVRLSKPRIKLVDENGDEVSSTLDLELDENNKYHGKIQYKIYDSHDADENKAYEGGTTIQMYLDYNYDGYFAQAEKVTEFLNVGGVIDVQIDDMGPGILPWKLEVYAGDNECMRDSVQGYFNLSGHTQDGVQTSQGMKVLQIVAGANKDNKDVDLQYMVDKNKDSVLAYFLKGAEGRLGVDMQFATMTVGDVSSEIGNNADYLRQWDVVVLTLDGADVNEIQDALVRYVENDGRSLLVCGQEVNENLAGMDRSLLGQTNGEDTIFTFTRLGGSNGYQRYKDLNDSMYGLQNRLKAENINEGIITCYPYSIKDGFTFEQAMQASPYLLDFDDNLKTDSDTTSFVTVWYTLGSDNIDNSAYYISPRDARNNYYCYSKGNVVYLAQSKYPYTYDSQGGALPTAADGAEECKLFVNALAAAYSAGLHNAQINIVSGFSVDAADIQTISVPFDEAWVQMDTSDPAKGVVGNTVDVFFKFSDNNMAVKKVNIVGFYYESESGQELFIDGETKYGTPFEEFPELWTVTDNRLVQADRDNLQPSKIYRFEAPVIPLGNKTDDIATGDPNKDPNKADIYVVLETTFMRNNKEYVITSVDSVSLNRARLFLLE